MTKLFAALRKKRQFERAQLPFLKALVDFDIIIEIGYAEEQKEPLTPKQLYLMKLGPPTTVRRRLAALADQGVVARRQNAHDRRSTFLTIASSSLKVLGKYGKVLAAVFRANLTGA
jgi:DNA-binding MarR family transcriptional regulator